MIVLSLLLVVISAVSLLVGGLFRDDLLLIYVSIGAALAAAAFLALGVLRGTRRRKPTKAATLPGDDPAGRPAEWQGAGWGGPGPESAALPREDTPATVANVPPTPAVTDETVRIDESAYAPPPPAPTPAPSPPPPAPAVPPVTPPPAAWAPPPPPAPPPTAAPASQPPPPPATPAGGHPVAPPPPPPPPPA